MNCCNANGVCDQGKDCPIRKQHIKETDDAYVKGYIIGQEDFDPYRETLGSFKELITVIVVATAVGLLSYVLWGKL